MKKTVNIITFLLLFNTGFSQMIDTSFVGKYSDGTGDLTISELILREDGTFYLKTPDPVFSYTHKKFENEGVWVARNDSVILNPQLSERTRAVELIEKDTNLKDSVLIKINYHIDYFRSDTFLRREEHFFDLLTVCINKKRKCFNLVRHPHRNICAFASKVKNQVLIDSSNTFRVKRKELDKVGLLTYGFEDYEWINVSDKNSDYLEVTIIQQIDYERTPRNRELIVGGEKVYLYKRKGKISKWLRSLEKESVWQK